MNLTLSSVRYYWGNTNSFMLGKPLTTNSVKQLTLNAKYLPFVSCNCVCQPAHFCKGCAVNTNSCAGLTVRCTISGVQTHCKRRTGSAYPFALTKTEMHGIFNLFLKFFVSVVKPFNNSVDNNHKRILTQKKGRILSSGKKVKQSRYRPGVAQRFPGS